MALAGVRPFVPYTERIRDGIGTYRSKMVRYASVGEVAALMIDLHSHILPGIDDGAESVDVSIAMLDAAKAIGISAIVATPHLHDRVSPEYAATIDRTFDQVEPLARERGIALERGFEIRLAPGTPAQLRAGNPITLAGSRVALVDLPFVDWPIYTEETLFSIQTSGFLPIFAHPERYRAIQKQPALARELVDRGVALQVTVASLAGTFGRSSRHAAEALIQLGAVHLVATDAHSAGHRMAAVPAGLERLRELVGDDGLHRLTIETPATLLNDDGLPPPVQPLARSGIRRLFAGIAR